MRNEIKPITSGETFHEKSYSSLFKRFLRYGLLAWGGPIAQLALIEREMVYAEKKISQSYFNRLIAIYQAVPGPETHEICVHLGTQAGGLFGGLLAGLGFMLPGFILMMLLSWLYILYGITPLATAVLLGIKPAVIAWIVIGGIQLGRGILINWKLWIIAIGAFFAELCTINFLIIFLSTGLIYSILVTDIVFVSFIKLKKLFRSYFVLAISVITILLLLSVFLLCASEQTNEAITYKGSALSTFILGLKCGSLSFGSVYAVLSIIKTDAIAKAHFLTQAQFIDGLALAGALPAPFIIVSTFVGYLAWGFWGGVLATLGTFLIPFLIPMFGFKLLNKVSTNARFRVFLDGIIAGVAGLIAADVLDILRQILISPLTIIIFIISLVVYFFFRPSYVIVLTVLGSGLLGIIFGK